MTKAIVKGPRHLNDRQVPSYGT